MPLPDETLRSAIVAHNAGRLTEAEVGYGWVLRQNPNDARALYGLGLLSYHSGAQDKGIQYLCRSLEFAPGNGRAWITLGSMYVETGRPAEAKGAYGRATQVAPELSDGWYNVGICLKREGDFDGAIAQLRRAVACATPFPQAYDALAALFYEQGKVQEAAQTLADWAVRDPKNPKAQHMAAAASAREAPPRASDEYVRTHFDAFADGFDRKLEELNYRAPELVAGGLQRVIAGTMAHGEDPRRLSSVLDAGCGTGLCGQLVRTLCHTLVGVDLSPKMLLHAQSRGCYDELVAAELVGFMRARPSAFDAIVCADTLVYFGPLEEPLSAARKALKTGGTFVFTVEALANGEAADHKLELSGRYAHGESYLRRVLEAVDFQVESLSRVTLRQERSEGVVGYLVAARSS
jgi:predicted TPR repeat methyltransferase